VQHRNNSLETMGWDSAVLDVKAGYCIVSLFFKMFCGFILQVVTFDAGGVSGHANHISLYTALRYSVLRAALDASL